MQMCATIAGGYFLPMNGAGGLLLLIGL